MNTTFRYAGMALLFLLLASLSYLGLGLYILSYSNPRLSVGYREAYFSRDGLIMVFNTSLTFTSDPGGFFSGAVAVDLIDPSRNRSISVCSVESFPIAGLNIKKDVTVKIPYSYLYTGGFQGPLFNDTRMLMNVTVTVENSFIRIYTFQASPLHWKPPFGNFTVSLGRKPLNNTHDRLEVIIRFRNWSVFDFRGSFRVIVNNKYGGESGVTVEHGRRGEVLVEVDVPRGEEPIELLLYILPDGGRIGPFRVSAYGVGG